MKPNTLHGTLSKVFAGIILLSSVVLLNGCKKEPSEIKHIKTTDPTTPVADTSFPCGNFRTQTQGGWGASPHGNNPGTYLHANFAGAFPTGLVVGCTKTLTFTTAQAITNYLPAGGPGAALTNSYVNPVGLKNVLAAQVVTLTLSVQFDAYDPNFSGSTVSLADLIIASGTFKGWTIKNVLAEANRVLGGCASIYTPAQLNDVITSINENFDDGTVNKGFVTCPGTGSGTGHVG